MSMLDYKASLNTGSCRDATFSAIAPLTVSFNEERFSIQVGHVPLVITDYFGAEHLHRMLGHFLEDYRSRMNDWHVPCPRCSGEGEISGEEEETPERKDTPE